MRGLTEHLSDPGFWKALATARRQDPGGWICHWRRFIDHIALDGDAESFFSSLSAELRPYGRIVLPISPAREEWSTPAARRRMPLLSTIGDRAFANGF